MLKELFHVHLVSNLAYKDCRISPYKGNTREFFLVLSLLDHVLRKGHGSTQ